MGFQIMIPTDHENISYGVSLEKCNICVSPPKNIFAQTLMKISEEQLETVKSWPL